MTTLQRLVCLGWLGVVTAVWECPGTGTESQGMLHLTLRKRVETTPGSGRFQLLQQPAAWEAEKTAVIVCDMWAKHWCAGARRRGAEMAPRINQFLQEARKRGVLVIHAPSGAMDLYKDHPARKRAQGAPKAANLPKGIADWCNQIEAEKKGKYPIDQSDGGCDDQPPCDSKAKMDLHQTPVLEIRDDDALSDSGVEIWNLMEQRGIANVILLGVHTNMCVLGRPFGLRNMARFGKHVVLVRDLTDTMYNPRAWPRVSHFRGTELIVEHIEKYVCPTITSDQLLGGKPFRFSGDVIVTATSPTATAAAQSPIAIDTRRELLVDDYLLDRVEGKAALRLHRPIAREVVLVFDQPWEGNSCGAYSTVFVEGGRYRMYYQACHQTLRGEPAAHPPFMCYAEISDGIHWLKPKLGLFEFAGSKENNIIWTGLGAEGLSPFTLSDADLYAFQFQPGGK